MADLVALCDRYPQLLPEDKDREKRIVALGEALAIAATQSRRRLVLAELEREVRERSARMVAVMKAEAGLGLDRPPTVFGPCA